MSKSCCAASCALRTRISASVARRNADWVRSSTCCALSNVIFAITTATSGDGSGSGGSGSGGGTAGSVDGGVGTDTVGIPGGSEGGGEAGSVVGGPGSGVGPGAVEDVEDVGGALCPAATDGSATNVSTVTTTAAVAFTLVLIGPRRPVLQSPSVICPVPATRPNQLPPSGAVRPRKTLSTKRPIR